MKHYLALDPGKTTGFAFNDGLAIVSGKQTFSNYGYVRDYDKRLGYELLDFWKWLNQMVVKHKISSIKTETWLQFPNAPVNRASTDWLSGVHNLIRMSAAFNSITYESISLQLWRGHFTNIKSIPAAEVRKFQVQTAGSKDPKNKTIRMRSEWWKKQTLQRCEELNLPVKNHNEADAIGILYYCMDRDFPEFGVKQMELFK